MRPATHDLRAHLHCGIRRLAVFADELVDSHPLIALGTAFGILRYVARFLGGRGATDARSDLN